MITAVEAKTGMPLLRLALTADAVVTGANGAVYLVAATLLDDVLGPQATFIRAIGGFLVLYGVLVGLLATRTRPHPLAVEAVIAGNVGWVIASIAYAVGSSAPTALGVAWIIAQAAVVGGFAVLQFVGLRRR